MFHNLADLASDRKFQFGFIYFIFSPVSTLFILNGVTPLSSIELARQLKCYLVQMSEIEVCVFEYSSHALHLYIVMSLLQCL